MEELGHIFEKTMTSPPKNKDRLAKAYNASYKISRYRREVTEDSPDYDEYYDEETWDLPHLRKYYVPQISIVQKYFWHYLYLILKVEINVSLCFFNECYFVSSDIFSCIIPLFFQKCHEEGEYWLNVEK